MQTEVTCFRINGLGAAAGADSSDQTFLVAKYFRKGLRSVVKTISVAGLSVVEAVNALHCNSTAINSVSLYLRSFFKLISRRSSLGVDIYVQFAQDSFEFEIICFVTD